jgi:hypothetical protein
MLYVFIVIIFLRKVNVNLPDIQYTVRIPYPDYTCHYDAKKALTVLLLRLYILYAIDFNPHYRVKTNYLA